MPSESLKSPLGDLERGSEHVPQNLVSQSPIPTFLNSSTEVYGGKEIGRGKHIGISTGDPKRVGLPHILHECA